MKIVQYYCDDEAGVKNLQIALDNIFHKIGA